MIMQINLLKSLVEEMAGSSQIVDILFDKKDVNEFLIAKKMNLTINQVRNILYKLSAEGLVSFTRKKDKKKGWYIYFWTLNTEKCLLRIEKELIRKMEELKQLLKDRETKRYYLCKGCNIELTEEKALEHDFACEECAEVYSLVDNTNALRDIKGKITKKENELKDIRDELAIITDSKSKKRQADIKKEEKQKKIEKDKKSKERKAAAAKKKAPAKQKKK
jgi:transcription factor E